MPDPRDRAQLGEQVSDRDLSDRSGPSEEGISADTRQNQDENESPDRVPRESIGRDAEDASAGDEGIDDAPVRRSASTRSTSLGRDARKRDVREESSVSRESSRPSQGQFTGRGGQKEAESDEAEGTGYTNDRSGQLQEDDSLSGSQGRHGTKGSRHGSTDRGDGQTAQNPRGKKVDRTKM